MLIQAVGDALEFLLILGVDLGPEHFAAGAAEEFPAAGGVVGHFQTHYAIEIGDFGSHQVAVLDADIVRGAFEVDVGPAAPLEAVAASEGYVVGAVLPGDAGWGRMRGLASAGEQKREREQRKKQKRQGAGRKRQARRLC